MDQSLYMEKRSIKASIWGLFDIWPPHCALRQGLKRAEQLLVSFKLSHCSSRVTRMLLKSPFRVQ